MHPPVRRRALRIAATLAIAVMLAAPSVALAWDAGTFSAGDESLLVTLTNQARASAGLKALVVDSTLHSVARWRSQDMEDRGYFSHTTPEGTTVFDELHRLGYCYVAAGENIGRNNYPDDTATQTVFDGFMGSSAHRANILGTYDYIGVGAYKGSDGYHVWTMLFAIRCSGSSSGSGSGSGSGSTTKPRTTGPAPAPTATPTPTPSPTPTPEPLDPDEAQGALAGALVRDGPDLPGVRPSHPPFDSPDRAPAGVGGLQIVDPVQSQGLVATIVGSVAGSYFGP